MAHTQNLKDGPAIEKLREIIGHNAICMFHTVMGKLPEACPMMIQEVDDDGNLWFLSNRLSEKNARIRKNPCAMITVGDNSHSEYLWLQGDVTISDDLEKKRALFTLLAKAWFPDGAEDKELTLLCLRPTEAKYWDTTDGKVAQMLKITGVAITGNMKNTGSVHGQLDVTSTSELSSDGEYPQTRS